MSRWEPLVAVFIVIALLWGGAGAVLVDAADWAPLTAPASVAVLLAGFGWARRGRDVVDVVVPGFFVAYAAYVGLALARLSGPNLIALEWRFPPLAYHLPAVLLAGLPFGLILAVFVAVPVALLAPRRPAGRADSERFWNFVHEQNARHAQPPPPPALRDGGTERPGPG